MGGELFVLARKAHSKAEYVTHVSGFAHTRGAQVSFTKLVCHAKTMSRFYAELHIEFLAKHYDVAVEIASIPEPETKLNVKILAVKAVGGVRA